MESWSEIANKKGIRYFLVAFVDLFGVLRSKLVPAVAMDQVAKSGAGFAGFAVWYDMTPADADMVVMPEQESIVQLPWKPEVAWVTGDVIMGGKQVDQNPRHILKRLVAAAAADGMNLKTGVECEFFLVNADGSSISRRRRQPIEALLRPAGPDAALRCGLGDLRWDGWFGLEAVPERPRGRQRPIRNELGIRYGLW